MAVITTLRDYRLRNKRVFLRLDLNVPLSAPDPETGERMVEDDSRITESLPTLKYLIEQGARVIIASHLGRPEGRALPEFSLEPVARRLATLLEHEVTLLDDCVGDGIDLMVQGMREGEVVMLENLRFHAEEEANETEFAHRLAKLGQIYFNDAFGTAHRKHASTYGVPALMVHRGMGFLMERELSFLDPLLHQPAKPFFAVLGGAKVTDKIQAINTLIRKLDGLAVGGVMAHAFWLAEGRTLPAGARQPKPQDIDAAKKIIKEAKLREIPLLIPEDTVDGCDIGPRTVEAFCKMLAPAKTIFWNGPLGWFEKPEYAAGTFAVARSVAELKAVKVVGGGDTVSAIKQCGAAAGFSHLSTGGGAVLEYLEGNGLPGVEVLKLKAREIAVMQEETRKHNEAAVALKVPSVLGDPNENGDAGDEGFSQGPA